MQFSAALVLATAILGVSANVHSKCHCTVRGSLSQKVTADACTNYPKSKFFDDDEKLVQNPSSVVVDIDVNGECESKDAATGDLAAHLGGKEFSVACEEASPGAQSKCN